MLKFKLVQPVSGNIITYTGCSCRKCSLGTLGYVQHTLWSPVFILCLLSELISVQFQPFLRTMSHVETKKGDDPYNYSWGEIVEHVLLMSLYVCANNCQLMLWPWEQMQCIVTIK